MIKVLGAKRNKNEKNQVKTAKYLNSRNKFSDFFCKNK